MPLLLIGIALSVVAVTPLAAPAGGLVILAGALAGAALGSAPGVYSTVKLGAMLVVILIAAFAVRAVAGGGELGLVLAAAFVAFAAAWVSVARAMLLFAWRRLVAGGASTAI